MFKCKPSHALGAFSRSLMSLIMGFLIGARVTTFWYNLQNENSDLPENEPLEDDMTALSSPEYLFNSTRVLCWVLTNPANHLNKAIHIRNTWGRRCNRLIFMSTEEDDELKSIKLEVEEGRHQLWNKTKMALKYIYDHHYDEAEWFLKADDDTYIVMENLRYLLYSYSPDIPIYFGAKFKPMVPQGYMSGGAGYVLSKESLKKFALEAYENPKTCPKIFKSEDVQLGFCLQNIGVVAGDSRDEWGKERFLPLAIEHLIPKDVSLWYKKYKNYTFYEHKENEECCSSKAISFHYIEAQQFYVLDYLIYTLQTFGVSGNFNFTCLPTTLNSSDAETNLHIHANPVKGGFALISEQINPSRF